MSTTAIDNGTDLGISLAHLSNDFSRVKDAAGEMLESGKHTAESILKHAEMSAEDLVDDTTYFIKRRPWQAVGAAACIGTAAGLLFSLLLNPPFHRGD